MVARMKRSDKKALSPTCTSVVVRSESATPKKRKNTLLVGNWFQAQGDQPALSNHPAYTMRHGFDTVMADYLIAALGERKS